MKYNNIRSIERIHAFKQKITEATSSFSRKERLIFYSLLWVFAISAFITAFQINKSFLVEIPAHGGSLTEGVIGAPRFINPLLAISDADRDLAALAYSGLMRAQTDGSLSYDLASGYTISDDGTSYTFTLKEEARFHDGVEITADDIVFTIMKAQDPILKSPKRAGWEGVSVEKIDNKTIRFTLKQPYSPFLENTTIGILPKHIWKDIEIEQFSFSQFNIEPIGSGPYKIKRVKRNRSGVPEYYSLESFGDYALGEPYIDKINIRFYVNESALIDALLAGKIEAANAISPETAKALSADGYRMLNSSLPRVFGVFFNQNQAPIFTDIIVRKALDTALDKEKIINEVLSGYGTAIDGPIPPSSFGYVDRPENTEATSGTSTPSRTEKARDLLERGGWEYNEETRVFEKDEAPLSFSLATSNIPELETVGNNIKEQLEKIGVRVELKIFDIGDLNQNIIRPRKYDALLFGEIIGRSSDLFAFWHSSQRNDPGLNIAQYANITTDKLLEDARAISDTAARKKKFEEFQKEIDKDAPAIFLYAPDFIYIIPQSIKGVSIGLITIPSERFLDIHNWYIETDHIWRFLAG